MSVMKKCGQISDLVLIPRLTIGMSIHNKKSGKYSHGASVSGSVRIELWKAALMTMGMIGAMSGACMLKRAMRRRTLMQDCKKKIKKWKKKMA